jgi:hypothetical protein
VSATVRFTVPVRTVSESNTRCFWAVKAKRVKMQRQAVALLFPRTAKTVARRAVDGGLTVELVRVARRELDDDNLRGALKAVRDEVAKQLGVDDADKRVSWTYGQRVGPYAVEVTITPVIAT